MSATTVETRPFPALTPEQRLYLDINGYVIIRNVLSDNEIQILLETIYEIEKAYRDTGQLPGPNCHLSSDRADYFRIDNLPHLADSFFRYLTHPYIVGLAEEIVGGTVRLEQSDAHIRRPLVGRKQNGAPRYGFHRGINPGFSHTGNGLYHFSFVKALTNLTDLGPDDGGTTVIAGTHKISQEVNQEEIVNAAMRDPRMIHHVEAPPGSVLLFFESLIHAAGIIESDRDRVLILGGYTPTMFQAWNGYEADPDFAATVSEGQRSLLTGGDKYGWHRKARELGSPAESVERELS